MRISHLRDVSALALRESVLPSACAELRRADGLSLGTSVSSTVRHLCCSLVLLCPSRPHRRPPPVRVPRIARECLACVSQHPPWEDVAFDTATMAAVEHALVMPAVHPHLCHRLEPLLLYGPPGTGKTMIVRAAARRVGRPLLMVSPAVLLSRWMGESERAVRALFAAASTIAAASSGCFLFFDEADALCRDRGAGGDCHVSRRVATELLLRLQDLPAGVHVVAATNLPWELDPAFHRRFGASLFLGLPPPHVRLALLQRELREIPFAVLSGLLPRLEAFSVSDVLRFTRAVAARPLQRLQAATHFKRPSSGARLVPCPPCDRDGFRARLLELPSAHVGPPALEASDCEAAMGDASPSSNASTLARYQAYRS